MRHVIENIKVAVMCWNDAEWMAFIILVSVLIVLLAGKIVVGA